METDKRDRSFAELISDVATDTSALVRKEVELAKAELSEKASQAGGGAVALVIGGLVAFGGFIVLLDAAVYSLAVLLDPYGLPLAAFLVAIATIVLGAIILAVGRSRLRAGNLAPRRTFESLRRDKQFMEEQVR